MYFLNQFINYAENFLKNIKYKIWTSEWHRICIMSLEKFLFQFPVMKEDTNHVSFETFQRMDKIQQRFHEQQQQNSPKPLKSCIVSQLPDI